MGRTPQRATWSYFVRRCTVEGTAKAQLAHFVGAAAGLQSERHYVATVLPRAVLRDLAAGVRRQPDGFRRAAAITIGLAITTAAYARGLLTIKWAGHQGGSHPPAESTPGSGSPSSSAAQEGGPGEVRSAS